MKKFMKKTVALALAMSMVFSTVVVSNAAKKKAGKVAIKTTGVSVAKKTITIGKKKTVKLTVAAKKPTVKASKKGIVTVKKSGKTLTVKGKKTGKTTLTIKKKGFKTVKVTVKVAKKAPAAIKASAVDVVTGNTADVKVTTKAKKIVAKVADKKVATAKVAKKVVTVTGVAEGATTLYVYDKANAANFKDVAVKVADKTEVVKAKDGVITLPALDNIKSASIKLNGVSAALTAEETAEIIKAVKDGKVADLLKAKTSKTGDIKVAGVDVKVKTAFADNKAVLTYGKDAKSAKDYTVSVDDKKSEVSVNGITFTYNKEKNTLTSNATGSKKTKLESAEITFVEFK